MFASGGTDYRPPVAVVAQSNSSGPGLPGSDPTSMKDLLHAMSSMVSELVAAALRHQPSPSHQPPPPHQFPPSHQSVPQHQYPPSHPPPPRYPSYSAPGGAGYNPPRWAPSNFNTAPQGCVFCSAPEHYIRECPVVADYHRHGIITKNKVGKIVLPDGRYCTTVLDHH